MQSISYIALPPSGPGWHFIGDPQAVEAAANKLLKPALVCTYDAAERLALGGCCTGWLKDAAGRTLTVSEQHDGDPAEHAAAFAPGRALMEVRP